MRERLRRIFGVLGPGFVTGASDDDPAGIATYSQAGAAFAYQTLWIMLFAYPLMSAVQMIAGDVGRVTGEGLAANLRERSSRWLLFPTAFLVFAANTINVGADIGGMAAATKLLLPGPTFAWVTGFGIVSLVAEVFIPYESYAKFLKWITLSLFAYIVSGVLAGADWGAVVRSTFLPHIQFTSKYLMIFLAVMGTTLSPYLLFWQASQEVEEEKAKNERPAREHPAEGKKEVHRIRTDTLVGMAFANLIAFSIMLTCAATLNAHGKTDIQSAAEAARALRPFAGSFASYVFAAGIVGTGLLAVPVLAGSGAFAFGEALGWKVGLEKKAREAKAFYGVITISTLLGIGLNLLGVNIIKFLVATALINGIVEVPVLVLMMRIAQNRDAMRELTISRPLRILGWTTVVVMTAAAVGMFVTL